MPWKCKDGGLKMGFKKKKGFCKDDQELKDLKKKNILRDGRNRVWKPREVIFLARNGAEMKKM